MSRLDLVTEALEGLKATEHLDEDWVIPCMASTGGIDCERPAAWVAWVVSCCPGRDPSVLWCTPCKDEFLSLESPFESVCDRCGRVFRPVRTAFRLIEPLNRRTT